MIFQVATSNINICILCTKYTYYVYSGGCIYTVYMYMKTYYFFHTMYMLTHLKNVFKVY